MDLGFPVAPPQVEQPKPILRIDHGKGDFSQAAGTWNYAGVSIPSLSMVFLAVREWRMLFAKSYDEDPDAPIVCASWDGVSANGRGSRDPHAPIELRACCDILPGGARKRLCPSSKGASKSEWICRPHNEFFMLVLHNEEWVPAFFDCRSLHIKPAMRAYQNALVHEKATSAAEPRYWQMYTPEFTPPDPRREGRQLLWGRSSLIPEGPDREAIADWVREHGKTMWEDRYKGSHEVAMNIGVEEETSEAQPEKEEFKDAKFTEAEREAGDTIPF
jgi:hypothetical protein